MGSGAFLVAACRYLSAVAEEALIEEGTWHAHDVTSAERAMLRREVASRCLFGVDLNPMAVQLARLSIWLATLATDKPLSFLDHHLVAGNSLVGASPDDLRRQPGGGAARSRRHEELPLFPAEHLATVFEQAVRVRLAPHHGTGRLRGYRSRQGAGTGLAARQGVIARDMVATPRPLVRRVVLDTRPRPRPRDVSRAGGEAHRWALLLAGAHLFDGCSLNATRRQRASGFITGRWRSRKCSSTSAARPGRLRGSTR